MDSSECIRSDVICPEDGWHLRIRINNCIAPSRHDEIQFDQCIEVEMAEKLHQFFVKQAVGHLLNAG